MLRIKPLRVASFPDEVLPSNNDEAVLEDFLMKSLDHKNQFKMIIITT